jgi:hypothetical protein
MTLPGGAYADDPASGVASPFSPDQHKSYDWALKRWLPVPTANVAPDGLHYAYLTPDIRPGVHVVDIATGSDRLLGLPRTWLIVAYASEGIYLGGMDASTAGFYGLWVMNPTTGEVKSVSGGGLWGLVGSGAAVGHDPAADYQTVVRLDLASGHEEVWSGQGFLPIAIDGAGRLIGARSAGSLGADSIEVLSGPITVAATYHGPDFVMGFPFPEISPAVVDGDRVWIGGMHGIYLLTSGGILKVSDSGGIPVGGCH